MNELLTQVIQQLESGIIIVDKDGSVLIANPSAVRFLKLPQEIDLQKCNIFEVKELSTFVNIYCEILASKKPVIRKRIIISGQGKDIVLGLNGSPIMEEGNLLGVVFLFTDLTDIEKIQQELEMYKQLEHIGELTAEMVHEFRNPLSVISGITEFLIDKFSTNSDLVSNLKYILGETEQINLLIARYLSFAKLKEINIEKQTTDYIIQRAISLCSNIIKKYNAIIDVEEIPKPLRFIFADSEKLAGALSNLIRNAVEGQYEQQRIWVRLSVYEKEGEIVFRIEGAEPFSLENTEEIDLADSYADRKKGGTRIELSALRFIILAHRGWIRSYQRKPLGIAYEIGIPLNLRENISIDTAKLSESDDV
ncbi:MAG: PAS domain S-box protein [Candidatus Hydrogenedens sp.]|nr:PAS domain S-box protein [Candidatus Hydrogenedens sp.]